MNKIIQDFLVDDNCVNIYPFGSRVYGSHNNNSDYDYIVVVKEKVISTDVNIHIYTIQEFQHLLDNCEIQTLECVVAPKNFVWKERYEFDVNIDKTKLRTSISTISSNSWVKGKKKLTVLGDYDLNAGLKSVFHSLRILDFGIQIGLHVKIINLSSMNYVLFDIQKMSETYNYVELWNMIDIKYRSLYNVKNTQFKKLCPKDTVETTKRAKIKAWLKSKNIDEPQYAEELLEIFK